MTASLEHAEQALNKILSTSHYLSLATVDALGNPHASHTPFVVDKKKHFYVFISEVSATSANLLNNKEASIILLDRQSADGDPFTPKRLRLQCNVVPVLKGSDVWTDAMSKFEKAFAEKAKSVMDAPEQFLLIQLTPFRGRLVISKDEIYDVDGNRLEEIKPFTP